jgi:hypothetical protein
MGEMRFGREEEEEEGVGGSVDCRVSIPSPEVTGRQPSVRGPTPVTSGEGMLTRQSTDPPTPSSSSSSHEPSARCARHLFFAEEGLVACQLG